MAVTYKPVLWNPQKRIYDTVVAGFSMLYVIVFVSVTLLVNPQVTQETLIIRSTGTLAFVMLHFILVIGPLSRLDKRYLPLLYNRRHLGVSMFIVAATHGVFSVIQFHALGNINPLISVFTSNTNYFSLILFPFETFGVFALLILFLMAATSHDFWLHNLSPRIWKTLHMGVYFCYGLLVLHVLLGFLQYETSPWLVMIVGFGMICVIFLHLLAGYKERRADRETKPDDVIYLDGEFLQVCLTTDIPENRARVVCANGKRIAIFRYENKISAVSNVCKHQLGPLGEGKIVNGCITCPWHGYQYLPHNGASPPPFQEKVATYRVRVVGNQVWVDPRPLPEGTEVTPATSTS